MKYLSDDCVFVLFMLMLACVLACAAILRAGVLQ